MWHLMSGKDSPTQGWRSGAHVDQCREIWSAAIYIGETMHIIHSLKYDELWKYNSAELSFILIEPSKR